MVPTRIQGPFERALVQTHTSKNEIPAYKAVVLTKDIVCLWMNNSHVVYFFSLLILVLLGTGQQHLKLYYQNHSEKVVLVMQSLTP